MKGQLKDDTLQLIECYSLKAYIYIAHVRQRKRETHTETKKEKNFLYFCSLALFFPICFSLQ